MTKQISVHVGHLGTGRRDRRYGLQMPFVVSSRHQEAW